MFGGILRVCGGVSFWWDEGGMRMGWVGRGMRAMLGELNGYVPVERTCAVEELEVEGRRCLAVDLCWWGGHCDCGVGSKGLTQRREV